MTNILIVEDEAIVAEDIKERLTNFGYKVIGITRNGKQTLKKFTETKPDLVFMDINLKGDLNGIETAKIIRSDYHVPVVYLTAYADEKTLQKAKISEPFGYILKPFEDRELKIAIEIAIHKNRMERRLIKSYQKIKHLNSVLEAVSSVNRLIVKEKNPYKLIKKACQLLLQNPKYLNTSIVLVNKQMQFSKMAFGKQTKMTKYLEENKNSVRLVDCFRKIFDTKNIKKSSQYCFRCDECIFSKFLHKKKNIYLKLKQQKKIFGLLLVTVKNSFKINIEELNLLEELADDISFALYSIELAEKNKEINKNLVREIKVRRNIGRISNKLAHSSGNELDNILHQVCKISKDMLSAEKILICHKQRIFATSQELISLPWHKSQKIQKKCPQKDNQKIFKFKLPSQDNQFDLSILVIQKKNQKLQEQRKHLLKIIVNNISLALEKSILEDRQRNFKKIVNKVIFMDAGEFQEKVSKLKDNAFDAVYLIADAVDSVNQKIDQKELQLYLKKIITEYGAIWGNAWGDMIHGVFSDKFKKTKDGMMVSAYKAAIKICNLLKEKLGIIMRVGIARGLISINKDTIQMNQYGKKKIIEKAALAQEGRPGISTLQKPSKSLKSSLKKAGYKFTLSEDFVRGSLRPVWRLYPMQELKIEIKNNNLSKNATLRLLMTKGVCKHGHLEGGNITPQLSQILKKASKLHEENPQLAQRFFQVTGKTNKDIMQYLNKFESWGESRSKFNFKKHFLSWLYIMKLGEASSPEIIYELTKNQVEQDLKYHFGITREIYPLVWIEMGLNFEECLDAFIRGIEDSLKNTTFIGPLEFGVGVKRQHLTKQISKKQNPFLVDTFYPYLKSLEVVSALKQTKSSNLFKVFVDVIDVARSNPLFSTAQNPKRTKHTERFFKQAKKQGAECFVHLLEELVEQKFLKKTEKRTKELKFIIDLFEDLRIQKARLIHMAYWPKNLPYLKKIESAKHEIAVCQRSTKMLGATHKPKSPFLLKNRKIIEGIIFDSNFPPILISTDDSGPFRIRNVWEEILIIHRDIQKWHGKRYADLSFIQFLRNAYSNLDPKHLSKKFKLNKEAVEWFLAFDIFTNKKKLKNKEIQEKVSRRTHEIIKKRKNFLKK